MSKIVLCILSILLLAKNSLWDAVSAELEEISDHVVAFVPFFPPQEELRRHKYERVNTDLKGLFLNVFHHTLRWASGIPHHHSSAFLITILRHSSSPFFGIPNHHSSDLLSRGADI